MEAYDLLLSAASGARSNIELLSNFAAQLSSILPEEAGAVRGWADFFRNHKKHSPTATFIPEIWQGHKNDGESAWIAMDKLENCA